MKVKCGQNRRAEISVSTWPQPRKRPSELEEFKNTWAGPGYRGINANYQTADGFVFELQFHTSASHTAKEEGTHALYEQQRLLARDTEAWEQLENAQNAIFDTIPTPSGALGLE